MKQSERAWRPSNSLVDVDFGCELGSCVVVVTRMGRLDNGAFSKKLDKARVADIHYLEAFLVGYKAVGV